MRFAQMSGALLLRIGWGLAKACSDRADKHEPQQTACAFSDHVKIVARTNEFTPPERCLKGGNKNAILQAEETS
jgi:hypothetical protein